MALPSSGTISVSDILAEAGVAAGTKASFSELETGVIFTINTSSTSYPTGARPHSLSEWYSYDHSATSWSNDYALDYDGVNDYVRGSITGSIPNRTFTVSMWVRIDATTKHNMSFYSFVGTAGTITNDRLLIYYNSGVNRLIVQFRRGSDGAQYIQAYPLHDSTNATVSGVTNSSTGWVASQRGNTDAQGFTHLCFAIDQTQSSAANGIKTYWNGSQLTYSVANTATCNTGLNCNYMSIGDNPSSSTAPSLPMEGVIDEVYLYSSQLSSTNVSTIYGYGRHNENTFTTNYVTSWRMENTVADDSGYVSLTNNGATFITAP